MEYQKILMIEDLRKKKCNIQLNIYNLVSNDRIRIEPLLNEDNFLNQPIIGGIESNSSLVKVIVL